MTGKKLIIRLIFFFGFFTVGFAFAATTAQSATHSFSDTIKEITQKVEQLANPNTKKAEANPKTNALPSPSATPSTITKTETKTETQTETKPSTTTTPRITVDPNIVKVEATPNANPAASSAIKKYSAGTNSSSSKRQPITLNFSTIPTRELIQIFAQFTGLNFIISDNVKGSMSINLKGIPWPQALTAILKSQGLAQRRVGNAIIIAPIDEVANQEAKELEAEQKIEQLKYTHEIADLQAQQRIEDLQPLVNKIVRLNYAKAVDISDLLTKGGSLLSPRGKVGVDTSSNTVWIRDTDKHASALARLIKKLDTPVKQVLIEARIVKIERPYEKSLGIKWGVTSEENNLSGTLTGANLLEQGIAPSNIPVADRLNFNQPASTLQSALTPATVGLALSVLGNFKIDLELSALEFEGKLETISKPRLITSNLQPAKITNGKEIPYAEASSSGATSIEFKEASLTLEVTPRITPDNRVILDIKLANDTEGSTVSVGIGQAVSINTEQEESQVLLDNGQTVVLGGVFKLEKNKTVTRIPFFGQIPIVGYLFKQTVWRNTRSELLIFITPKIINKPSDLNEE